MRILFICSSQGEGKDGVGDYVRRSASELIKHQHEVSVIGLFDRFTDSVFKGTQTIDGINVPVLRLPAQNGIDNNLRSAKLLVNEFNPDWISFHYVPYSYSKKGLPFGLGRKIKNLCETCKWQIMVHELWIGREPGSGLMRLVILSIQKALVKDMFKKILPTVIHTHLPVFYKKIKALGFDAKPLPLFSNIEKVNNTVAREPGIFRVGFFSQAAATASIVEFLELLAADLFNNALRVELIFIGGNREKMTAIGRNFGHIEHIKNIQYTGFLRDDEVSMMMQSCDLGITPFPRHALGKSSSLSVFFAHGLPVAAPNVHFLYSPDDIGFFSDELKKAIVVKPDLTSIAVAQKAAEKTKADLEIGFITRQFLRDISL